MQFVASNPDAYLDTTGRYLRRRLNCAVFWLIACAALLVAVLVLQVIGNRTDDVLDDKLSSAQSQFAQLQSLIQGSSIASAPVSAQSMFKCNPGLIVPRKWIVLGSAYAGGAGSSGPKWYESLQMLAGSSVQIIAAQGPGVSEQLYSLANNSLLANWVALSEPLLVFVEQGYVESMAAMAAALGEAPPGENRAASPVVLASLDIAIMSQPWWRGPSNRIVFLVPTLPYAPPLGGFVPAPVHVCTDPLAASLFNQPDSFLAMRAMSDLPNGISLMHALASMAAASSASMPLQASVQILTTDALFAHFGFNTASTPSDIAFAEDCLSLNLAGQRLLAQYLWSCLRGQEFDIPTSLPQKERAFRNLFPF